MSPHTTNDPGVSAIERALCAHVSEELLAGEAEIEPGTPLLALGVIDSLSMVSLLSFIQEHYGVDVADDDVTVENFEDVVAIARLVARLCDSAPSDRTGRPRSAAEEAVRVLQTSGVRSERVALTGGGELHTLGVGGADPAWILLPGLGNPASSWGTVLKACADDRRALAVDFAGFGLSSSPRRSPTWRDHVEDVVELVDRESEGPVTLVGSSAGCLVALEIARRCPERVHALVLVGFGLIDDPAAWLRELEALWSRPEEFLRRTFHHVLELTPLLKRQFDDVYGRDAYHSFLDADDLRPQVFDGIEVPTLVVAGESDRIIGLDAMRAAAERIGPCARLVELARCGHFPGQEQPEELVHTLERFLRDLGAEAKP